MQQFILTIILLFLSMFVSQAQENKENLEQNVITITVVNALNNTGTINFAFFDEDGFRKQPLFAKSAAIEDGISSVTFLNIPNGEYAIICFHDENENNKMDFHENGMPKESYGTSNNPMLMGPPNFESSKFVVDNNNVNLEIKF
ncbi:DUF2141 domain-containing protein [uncultured Lutibacter sp.]|uniref:DUF2141 domain-containing protein n=1 Tax=uncultured Lutibacter sp. TaxID=437739 RepID=UPI0026351CD4|nr:DUF2141 domain-containing protein [uncultured Lutibacter sp.]